MTGRTCTSGFNLDNVSTDATLGACVDFRVGEARYGVSASKTTE